VQGVVRMGAKKPKGPKAGARMSVPKGRPGQTRRAEKRAVRGYRIAGQSREPRSNKSLATLGRAMRYLADINKNLPAPKKRKIKTDQQIAAQVRRISESAFDRNRLLGERTLALLWSAADRVVSRAQRRQDRADANDTRIQHAPNSGARRNRLRSLAQQDARWGYSQFRQRTESVRDNVRQNAEITAAIKREQYERTPEGRNAIRRQRAAQRAAEDRASREWRRRLR
jgi:hypothetical protein